MYEILGFYVSKQQIFYGVMTIACLVAITVFLLIVKVVGRIIRKIIEKKAIETVINTSLRYKDILEINNKYNFHKLRNTYTIIKIHNSKAQFDRFDYSAFFEEDIEGKMDFYELLIDKSEENALWIKQYHKELENISPFGDENVVKGKWVPYFIYRKVEKEIVSDIILRPVYRPKVLCRSMYTSPKGRNSYHDTRKFNYLELIDHYNNVCTKIEQRESKEFQRKLMSDSLRYDILKRDGFRCVICGRSADDGIKLHVDHILPVSKGGKTVPNNLRTLCDSCNLGKSDKYDEYGYN